MVKLVTGELNDCQDFYLANINVPRIPYDLGNFHVTLFEEIILIKNFVLRLHLKNVIFYYSHIICTIIIEMK